MNYVSGIGSGRRGIPVAKKRPLVWLLMGSRVGDNNQLLALAEALGFPYEIKKLRYNQWKRIAIIRNGLRSLKRESRRLISAPWPDLVMAVGYASVPVARYIRQQSGGRTKLVHVGNPRARLDDFDLRITTPQYPGDDAPNVLELPFPIGNPARTATPTQEELRWLDGFPRPLRLIAVGGPARHWELDHRALRDAIRTISQKQPSGSLIVAVSKRTTEATRRLLQDIVSGQNEAIIERHPSFATLLAQSDEIHVTADSVSMLSEAVLSGKPVSMIPIRRSTGGQLSHWLWERPTGRATLPDFRSFWSLLNRERLIGTVDNPIASSASDTVDSAADAVRSLFAVPDGPPRVWALLGAHAGDNDQVIALAETLGLPFECKQLAYNHCRHLGPRLLGPSLLSLTQESRTSTLAEPPPDLTISVGHRSVAVVRALRRRGKGRTRSIHIGFPRISPRHFDLVITTPQYPIADHPNVLRVPFALTRAASSEWGLHNATESVDMPRPQRLLVVGGSTWFWEIDAAALMKALYEMIAEARSDGGSVIGTTSPRTPEELRDEISAALSKSGVASLIVGPGEQPLYSALLASADSIRVTADSVAMVSDAIWTAKPVALVPVTKSVAGTILTGLVDAIRPGHRAYPQDLRFFWRALRDVGVSERLAKPRTSTKEAMRVVLDRVDPILESLE